MIDFDNIRYFQDSSETYINTDNNFSEYIENLRKENLSISIKIKPEIFPEISKVIEHVQKNLLPNFSIEAFIRNDPEIQAMCFPGVGKKITIALTSGIIQLYSFDELKFVIGHEIGHHLYEHYRIPNIKENSTKAEQLNILARRRAAEITADRIGFLSAKRDDAFMAMIKLASGLPSTYIKKNFSAYLDQARELHDGEGHIQTLFSSHPSCTTRMRALMWFSMSEPYYKAIKNKNKAPLSKQKLDLKIANDLSAVGGNQLDKINQCEYNSAITWGIFSILWYSAISQNYLVNCPLKMWY